MRNAFTIFCIVSTLVFYNCKNDKNVTSQASNEQTNDNKATELKLEGIYNKPDNIIPTLKSLNGKIIVLDFWAIWCSPCVAAFPENNRIYEKYKNKGVEFIAITDDPEEKLENFLEKVEIKFWVGRDDDNTEFENYNIKGRPRMFIINRDGNIVYKGSDITESLIEEVLATNSIADTKEDCENMTVITNGGFSPGEDPLYNGVDEMLNIGNEDYWQEPKLINHFIIRPSLSEITTGYGHRLSGEHIGVTYYGGKLQDIFKFLNFLPSPVWVKDHTMDTTLYDIVYWKKSPNFNSAFKEIEESLLESLSLSSKKVSSLQNVNKIILSKQSKDIITMDNIVEGTEKAYISINTYREFLEKKSKEFYTIDGPLKKMYVYDKSMNWNRLVNSSLDEITSFLREKNIHISKVQEEIETLEIYNK